MIKIKKLLRMWMYGAILIIAVEMVREAKSYSKLNFHPYVYDLISILIFIFGPLFLFLAAIDYAKIDLNKKNETLSQRKSWMIAVVIAVGCIALIAVAFLTKK